MARYIGSVCRLCRREGEKLFLKGTRCYTDKCAIERRPYPPGQHGNKRKKISDYGIQLREKQKLKRIYGINERPMENLFDKALRQEGITGEILLSTLERRFDNVVYRLGLASSRNEARQLVKHSHFLINDNKVNIPSYSLKVGDKVTLRDASKNNPLFQRVVEVSSVREIPSWLEFDKGSLSGSIKDLPRREDITSTIEERLVVELYSK